MAGPAAKPTKYGKTNDKIGKRITRYTFDELKEPRTPETGHTALMPADEQVATLPMDNGWSKAIIIGKLQQDERPVVVDMDPIADPVLFWASKRNRREVPVLPLQRNEIVSESRIAQIIGRARTAADEKSGTPQQNHLFADLEKTLRESDRSKRVEFYTHDEGWKNKLICGDSLHVMESLLHYENLRGKVQMIYIDPPYGISYDSNFQQRIDSTDNDDKDSADDVLTIKAFRDTWALGIHSYLSYLQERLYLCRELLAETGSIFVQINDQNVHRVRCLLDEVFGAEQFIALIPFKKTSALGSSSLDCVNDYLVWYGSIRAKAKYHQLYRPLDDVTYAYNWLEASDGTIRRLKSTELSAPPSGRLFRTAVLTSQSGSETTSNEYEYEGRRYKPVGFWKTNEAGLKRLEQAGRLMAVGNTLTYKRYADDFPVVALTGWWDDTLQSTFAVEKDYAVQTYSKVISRCVLMATDPGDLIFDPTCGSGTTAWCCEKYGRRWITCDTSRVSLNVARQRLLRTVYEHFVTRNGVVKGGFVYKTVNRITLKSITRSLEPEKVELVDQPEIDTKAVRVCGPFEIASLGRYSVEDWKGFVVAPTDRDEAAKLENYIEVICRLYRKNAAVQGSSGLVHAISEAHNEKIAISVGPVSGRVTAKQVNDAVQDALASGILEAHILGWAFEANVGEVKSQLEKRGKVKVELIMIRPDTLSEGLKATQPEMLFSPLALPDIHIAEKSGKEKEVTVTLSGVALFDRKRRTTDYKAADSGYISAWYLDEDYDGDCFVDCQMFFDFKKVPNLKSAVRADIEPEEFKLKLSSEPFPVRGYKRIAVKVVDVYGNESTVVRDLA